MDVPVGVEQAEVHHPDVGADAFHFLQVPQREGVVVAVGEQDGVGGATVQQVVGAIWWDVVIGAVVVVPILGSHDDRRHE